MSEPWTSPPRGTIIDFLVGDAFRASGIEPPRATVYTDAINMRTRLAAIGPYQRDALSSNVQVTLVTMPPLARRSGALYKSTRRLVSMAPTTLQ